MKNNNVPVVGPFNHFDEHALTLYDPNELELELVAHSSARGKFGIRSKYALRGFYSATLSEEGFERTPAILKEELGFPG